MPVCTGITKSALNLRALRTRRPALPLARSRTTDTLRRCAPLSTGSAEANPQRNQLDAVPMPQTHIRTLGTGTPWICALFSSACSPSGILPFFLLALLSPSILSRPTRRLGPLFECHLSRHTLNTYFLCRQRISTRKARLGSICVQRFLNLLIYNPKSLPMSVHQPLQCPRRRSSPPSLTLPRPSHPSAPVR
jgi:hypothetical protein